MNKLQEACIISHEHWLKDIEQSIASIDIDIPEIKIPEKKKEKQPKNKKNSKISKKVIKILIIAAIIMALFMTVSAFTPFKDFIVEYFEDYNLLTNNDYEIHYPKEIKIMNLPEGFTLISDDSNKNMIAQEYRCGEKRLTISKYTPDTHFQVSNEFLETITFYNNEIKYSLFKLTDGCTEIIWLTNEYSYILIAFNMSNEELIEIVKNIK